MESSTEKLVLEKLTRIDESIGSIDRTLVRHEAQLAEHMRRTELAEENLKALRREVSPIKVHVSRVEGALKLLGILGVITGIGAGIAQVVAILSGLGGVK